MHNVSRWSSLADQIALAGQMYGRSGEQLLVAWLDHQLARVGDLEFAREFSDHIHIPGINPLDYAHRHLHTRHGELIAGIRFYGRDIERPFVEVLAHTFHDIARLTDCVAEEWSMFCVRYLRLRTKPGHLRGAGAIADQSIHVARYRDMRPPDSRVQLGTFDDVEDAITLVANRYRSLGETKPSPADADEIRRWHRTHELRSICVGDSTVGLLAIAPGSIGWIVGDEINEEVIATSHNGYGYAASAQAEWAAGRPDPDQFLCGTIDHTNRASFRTATNARRRHVLDDTFIDLTG